MEMITSAFLAKRVIEVTLGRMKELYAQLFFFSFVHLSCRVGEEFDDNIWETHPFLPHHPALLLPIFDSSTRKKSGPRERRLFDGS